MILGNSLLFALGAAGLGTLLYYVMTRLAINVWLCRWFALALALFIILTGPIVIGK
jgi:hypothetical protein